VECDSSTRLKAVAFSHRTIMMTVPKAKKKVKKTFSGKPKAKAPFTPMPKGKKARVVKKASKLIVGKS